MFVRGSQQAKEIGGRVAEHLPIAINIFNLYLFESKITAT